MVFVMLFIEVNVSVNNSKLLKLLLINLWWYTIHPTIRRHFHPTVLFLLKVSNPLKYNNKNKNSLFKVSCRILSKQMTNITERVHLPGNTALSCNL